MRGAFHDADADLRRLPTVLLSGALGSGKTTLVNALLRDPRMADTAVAVNEFGAVPLDGALIDQGGDSTLVLANGCLCCNLSGELDTAVMRLFSRRESGMLPRFARLIIEPSGLADPAPIAQAILRNPIMSRALRLDAIITVVDALFVDTQIARHGETRKQIVLADQLVVTKPDLAGAAAVAAASRMLRRLNPVAPIHVAQHGAVAPGALFPAEFLDRTPGQATRGRSVLLAEAVETAPAPDHLASVAAVRLTADQPLHWSRFDTWLRRLRLDHADRLLRLKGLLDVAGTDGPVLVQGVHHVLHDPIALGTWDGAPRCSRLLLIVEDDAATAIRQSWDAALPGLLAEPVTTGA
jgi:G3E family GTPase